MKRKYTLEHLKKVISLVNDHKMVKHRAIKEAGFNTRQSYYDTLKSLGYEEGVVLRKFENPVDVEKTPPRVSFI